MCVLCLISSGRSYSDVEGAPPHILAFMEHFNTLAWMTYRTNFPAIAGTSITTDCGWGCMVRSGQMILATALMHYLLGSDWRVGRSTSIDRVTHRQVCVSVCVCVRERERKKERC